MQAIVLLAGKGTRMARDYEGPKHLLPVAGKPIVEHGPLANTQQKAPIAMRMR